MEEATKLFLTEKEKEQFIQALTPELALLRAKAELSQEEIANLTGISRQTYGAIERKAKKMSWNTYLSLIFFYDCNQKTRKIIRSLPAFPHKLIAQLNQGDEGSAFDLEQLFQAGTKDIIETLDEKAIATIKTVLMVEYSRCNELPGEAVVKFFEGVNFMRTHTPEEKRTTQALKNIKRKRNE